jgi:MoCo/4Fe-4S cofactor protein with predicted Tat translocation signal
MSDIKSDNTQNMENTELHPNYWRSFEALYNDPAVIEAKGHEFKEGVTDDFSASGMSNLSRRKFLALLGASAAIAGTACTDYRDKGEIVPYNIKPEEITVGKPNFYASTCTACSNVCGILIKTREGRPIKVDGNPDHPVNKGKICAKGQANILNVYDPERLKKPLKNTGLAFNEISWKAVESDILAALTFAEPQEIAIVTNPITSPTALKVIDDFKVKFPTTKVYSYSLFNNDVKDSAWQKTYGSGKYPLIKWNEAKVIVALESDFLGVDGNKVENSRLFAEGRDVESKSFNRLYCVDSTLTITGNNAEL